MLFFFHHKPHRLATYVWVYIAFMSFSFLVYAAWTSARIWAPVSTEPVVVDALIPQTPSDVVPVAYEVARAWSSDAELARLTPLDATGANGSAYTWRATFTSNSYVNVGFIVVLDMGNIVDTYTVTYQKSGAAFPENAKTHEEAITEVRALPGREGVVVQGVEAVYNTEDSMWYWGVRTDMGIISVRMERDL